MSNSKMDLTGSEKNIQITSGVVDSGVGMVVGSAVPRVESEDG